MKPVFILITVACLVSPTLSMAEPLVGATSPSPGAMEEKAFCIRTKGMHGGPRDCIFATYQECKTSIAAVYAECYRNPRTANARMVKDQDRR